MKMRIKKTVSIILFSFCLVGCSSQKEQKPKLNEWQIELLEAEGLPTDYDELSLKQQNSIDRIWTMISYLNDKYGEEFIYVKYIPQELNQSESLIAYPRSSGSGNGKYYVTVKNKNGEFVDDYSDNSVKALAEELTNDFLKEHFGDKYKFFSSPLACDIKMSEMENGKFQWKYGAENSIFILEELCSIDNVEEFAFEYAKFLYEHELSGNHRIQVMKEFSEDKEYWGKNGENIFAHPEFLSTGFYSLYFNSHFHTPSFVQTTYVKFDLNAKQDRTYEFNISQKYNIEDYFSKSTN